MRRLPFWRKPERVAISVAAACPFCGGTRIDIWDRKPFEHRVAASCADCGARGPATKIDTTDGKRDRERISDVLNLWNTRSR